VDFSLTDEQKALSELSEKILTDHATLDRLKALEDSDECIDREAWAALAGAGLVGAALPESHGGSGAGLVEVCLILEQVGRAVAHVPFLPTVVHGALPIARFGTDEQRRRLLPGVAEGKTLLTAALSEVDGDARSPTTTATRTPDGFRLDGVKVAVPIARQAEACLVPARTEAGHTAVFVVDPRAAGVGLEPQETFN